MSQLRSEIPLMASLWIRSGYDMKVDPSVETYQVGAHFKALNEAVLMALAKILENFFSISSLSAALCSITNSTKICFSLPIEPCGTKGYSLISICT